jgi:hypothetical protein
MALNAYLQQTQRLIGDTEQKIIPPNDLIAYINLARNQVAELTQCIRILTPISNSIASIAVTNGGSGYSATPTVTITTPDAPGGTATNPGGLQATAVATVTSGTIASIGLTQPGSGYFQPQVTITDITGVSATATATIASISETTLNQEVYQFSAIPITSAGAGQVFMIKSISMIYDNYRYSLPVYSFSVYQAHIRRFPYQYSYVPTVASQYGQGTNGSLYLYPIASQTYQLELDCFCLPAPLTSDTSPELIPLPWSDSIPYFAAYLAFLQMQRQNDARASLDLFDKMLLRQSGAARPGRQTNPYGRW